MFEKDKISIIISTLNCDNTIRKSIYSSLEQTYKNLEVIVVDGGSTDKTIQIIESFNQTNFIKIIGEDAGIYDAWNKAINISTGEWICFIGGDDYWLNSDCVQLLISKSKNVNFVSAKAEIYNEFTRKSEIIGKKWNKNAILKGMHIAHPGSLHHCNLFKNAKFDKSYKVSGDHEFLIRCRNIINAEFLDKQIICMRDGGISRSKPFLAFYESYKAIKSNTRYGLFYALLFYILILNKFLLKTIFSTIKNIFKKNSHKTHV